MFRSFDDVFGGGLGEDGDRFDVTDVGRGSCWDQVLAAAVLAMELRNVDSDFWLVSTCPLVSSHTKLVMVSLWRDYYSSIPAE